MSVIAAIDPGIHGALALWIPDMYWLQVFDLPTTPVPVGRTIRARVDEDALTSLMRSLNDAYKPDVACIEEVGGKGKQPGSSGFVFGDATGLVRGVAKALGWRIVPAGMQRWKRMMEVPGKDTRGRKPDEIIHRADKEFPGYEALWRGSRGGFKFDRAEAALMAKWVERFILKIEARK